MNSRSNNITVYSLYRWTNFVNNNLIKKLNNHLKDSDRVFHENYVETERK